MLPETTLSLETIWAIYHADPADLFARAAYASLAGPASAGPAEAAQATPGIPLTVPPGSGIAVVSMQGVLEKRLSLFGMLFGGTSMIAVKAALNAALADKSVRAILLRADTPGGTVAGSTELADHVAAASRRKRLVAYVDGMAASAGYWAVSPAQEIWASRDSIVGSIGVLKVEYDKSEMAKREGVRPVVTTTGKHKAAGVPGTKITDEHQAEWQKHVDFAFAEFKGAVARGRRMSAEDVDAVADGRVFRPPESVELGLVDRVMSFEEAFAVLRDEERTASRARSLRMKNAASG